MSNPKKPGEETVRGLPAFDGQDRRTVRRDAYVAQSNDGRTLGENLGGSTGAHKKPSSKDLAAAPEVSQGAWRERVFSPRAVMSRADMLEALNAAVTLAKGRRGEVWAVLDWLRHEWLPVLRQAVEQAGGDGLDAWLLRLLKPPGRAAVDPLVDALAAAFDAMRSQVTIDKMIAQASTVIAAVDAASANPKPKRLSFKVLERELEGKLEIHELLLFRFCADWELEYRLKEIGATLDSLRAQLKSMPGSKPDGMYSNFGRLKAEARVLTAELGVRVSAPK